MAYRRFRRRGSAGRRRSRRRGYSKPKQRYNRFSRLIGRRM